MARSIVAVRGVTRAIAFVAFTAIALAIVPLAFFRPTPAGAITVTNGVRLNAVEARLVTLINTARTTRGIPALVVAAGSTDVARRWAASQAARRTMSHNPSYSSQLAAAGSAGWGAVAENVGHGRDPVALFNAYMASPGHRANILGRQYRFLGIGWAELPDHTGFNTQNFVDAYSGSYGPTREPAYGSFPDTRAVQGQLTLADFESGRDPRILTAVTGAGLTATPVTYDAPATGDQAGRFVARQTGAGSGGGVELRLRDALDLARASSMTITVGAVTATARPLTVNVAVRTAFGTTVNVGSVVVPSGRTITTAFTLPAGARTWRNEVVLHVSRGALAALDPAAYTGRRATVYVRQLGAA